MSKGKKPKRVLKILLEIGFQILMMMIIIIMAIRKSKIDYSTRSTTRKKMKNRLSQFFWGTSRLVS